MVIVVYECIVRLVIVYVAHVDGADGAAKGAKLVVMRYDIRTCAEWRQQDPSPLTIIAVEISAWDQGSHLGYIHVLGGHSNEEAVSVDGFHLQVRDLACVIEEISVVESVELSLCLVAEELEVRVVHVAGWAGWVHTGETAVEAEWEAYVVNAATGTIAWSRISRSRHGDEKKNWDHEDGDYDGGGRGRIHHHRYLYSFLQYKP